MIKELIFLLIIMAYYILSIMLAFIFIKSWYKKKLLIK